MNAIETATPGVLNPVYYQLGHAAGRASMVIDVLKEQLLLPLARGLIKAQESLDAGLRAARDRQAPIAAIPEPSSTCPTPDKSQLMQAPEQPATSTAGPWPRRRHAVIPRKRCVASRRRPIRRHRTRRPTAITAAVVAQVFHVSRRTLRRSVASGQLRDLREPGHAQNAPVLLDLGQIARRLPRRLGVKVSGEHWVLQLLDDEIFFAERPDIVRPTPDIRT